MNGMIQIRNSKGVLVFRTVSGVLEVSPIKEGENFITKIKFIDKEITVKEEPNTVIKVIFERAYNIVLNESEKKKRDFYVV